MYGYADHIEISPEQLLQKITQEQIFELVLKQPFSFNDRYCSPFRTDNHPGCRFEQRPDGTIVFVDFGEKFLRPHKTHRGAFGMVMDYFNEISMQGVVRRICAEFGLPTDPSQYNSVIITPTEYSKKDKISSYGTDLSAERKLFNKSDILFWSQFLIKTEHLTEDGHYAVRQFRISNHKGNRLVTPYQYCYCFDFIDKLKIYQPYSEKYKWITNCDENCIGNIDNLPATGEELIIQKSYKDHRVVRNTEMELNVCWFANEGCIPSLEILNILLSRFSLITIFYDNDEDGRVAAIKLKAVFDSIFPNRTRLVFLPEVPKHKSLYGHYLKDPGEFINKEGRKEMIDVLKHIGIYGKNN